MATTKNFFLIVCLFVSRPLTPNKRTYAAAAAAFETNERERKCALEIKRANTNGTAQARARYQLQRLLNKQIDEIGGMGTLIVSVRLKTSEAGWVMGMGNLKLA